MDTNQRIKHKEKVLYPELSYAIMGIVFEVHNALGGGLRENLYEKAIQKCLNDKGLRYQKQLKIPVKFKNEKVGNRFLDFLIEDKIVLELKSGDRFRKANLEQVYEYLKYSGVRLGILVNFGREEVKYKRIVNLN